MPKVTKRVLKDRFKKELISIIHKHIPEAKVYLFGSRAVDEEGPGSDRDLALDAGRVIPDKCILKISIDIEETTIPMSVDIVDLNNVSESFKREVLEEGILWES